ncbi:MAG: hypothetical protein HWN65_15280 [Candidatus Helarchaeota archaeon]|nr:hypothetical protein [Candidatus Helarchaeota archaeon]
MSQLVICPKCGRRFSKTYSRLGCGDCPSAAFGDCGQIKCPYCGTEFPMGGKSYVPRHLI